MRSPDWNRRRTLLWLGAGVATLAGCGDPDTPTPAPAPPPTGTPETPISGPGPDDGTPDRNETTIPREATPVPEDVVVSKPGGGEVAGTRYGTGHCGVVLVPQIDRDRQSWNPSGEWLSNLGYVALAIDEGEDRKAAGVAAGVGYLRDTVGVAAVVVIGASSGAEAAIQAAVANPEAIDAIVALSPSGGADLADRLTIPTLFVVGERDAAQYVTVAQQLAEDAPNGELVTYDSDAHGQALLESPHAEPLRSRIEAVLGGVCDPAATPSTADENGTTPTPTR